MKFTKNIISSESHFFIFAFLFITCSIFLFTSCKENEEEENPKEENKESYFPIKIGATWSYQDETNQNYLHTFTNQTKNIGGFDWKIISAEPNLLNEDILIRIDAATQKVYYGYDFTDDGGVLFTTAIADLDAKVGDTWTDSFEDEGFILTYTMTLVEKDIEKTMHGKSYKNVMSVKVEESISPLVDGISTDNSTWYFARGIGIIGIEYEDGDYIRLVDYSIQ